MKITPIATVQRLAGDSAKIIVAEKYTQGLEGIEPGHRLQILYWMHKLSPEDRQRMQVHPQGDRNKRLRGVFVLRGPMRPNPIGVSVVEVTGVRANELTVAGLDALEGTPVIDIKWAADGATQRLIEIWGRMHDGIIGSVTKELGEEKLVELLRAPLRAAGRQAAPGSRANAPAIAQEIIGIEELFDIRGGILENTPDQFVRQVTWCPWSWFRPLSCRIFAWWMEGFVQGMNPSFSYDLQKLMPAGDKTCTWKIHRSPRGYSS